MKFCRGRISRLETSSSFPTSARPPPPSNSLHEHAQASPCLGLSAPPPPPPDTYHSAPLSHGLPTLPLPPPPPPPPRPHPLSSAFSIGPPAPPPPPPPPPPPHPHTLSSTFLLGPTLVPPPHPHSLSSAFSIGPPPGPPPPSRPQTLSSAFSFGCPPPPHPPGPPAFFSSQEVGFDATPPPILGFIAPSDLSIFDSHSEEKQNRRLSCEPELAVEGLSVSFTRELGRKKKKSRHTDTWGYPVLADESPVTERGSKQFCLDSVLGIVGSTAVSNMLPRIKERVLAHQNLQRQMVRCGVSGSDVVEGSLERLEAPSPKTHNMLGDIDIDSISGTLGGSEPAAAGGGHIFMERKRSRISLPMIMHSQTWSSVLQQTTK